MSKHLPRIESAIALAVLLAAIAFSLGMGWYARSAHANIDQKLDAQDKKLDALMAAVKAKK